MKTAAELFELALGGDSGAQDQLRLSLLLDSGMSDAILNQISAALDKAYPEPVDG